MRRLLLTLQYDGARYHGWQVQPNGVTVQETLQDALERVTGVRSGITGCSRTDAGVHAEMFCCLTESSTRIPDGKLIKALNANLPGDIAVIGCREVGPEFHPRYSAAGKQYIYRIWNGPAPNPFWRGYALQRELPLDTGSMNATASLFLGTHDFSAFCSSGSSVEDKVRTVSVSRVERQGDLVTYTVEADGFLYNMVRIFVGTLLDVESGRLSRETVAEALTTGNRAQAGATAPACGLYLSRVFYPEDVF